MQQHISRTINMSTFNVSCTYVYKQLGYVFHLAHIFSTIQLPIRTCFVMLGFSIIATNCNSRIFSNIGAIT